MRCMARPCVEMEIRATSLCPLFFMNAYDKWLALLPQPGTVIGIDLFLSLCHKQG